jgi:hypothetical protein
VLAPPFVRSFVRDWMSTVSCPEVELAIPPCLPACLPFAFACSSLRRFLMLRTSCSFQLVMLHSKHALLCTHVPQHFDHIVRESVQIDMKFAIYHKLAYFDTSSSSRPRILASTLPSSPQMQPHIPTQERAEVSTYSLRRSSCTCH